MDFKNKITKRLVQKELFRGISSNELLALGGDSPEEYLKVIKNKFKRITLVDMKYAYSVNINEFITLKPGLIQRQQPKNVIDCDFCASVDSDGDILLEILEKMQIKGRKYKKKKSLLFTFSTRTIGGLEYTIDWLNLNLYNNSLFIHTEEKIVTSQYRGYIRKMIHSQHTFEESLLLRYRDTSNMVSGRISWH